MYRKGSGSCVVLCLLIWGCRSGDDERASQADSGAAAAGIGIAGNTPVHAAVDATVAEDAGVAARCADDAECSDGVFCNGKERCTSQGVDVGRCAPAERAPCARPAMCDEASRQCVPDCVNNPDADGDDVNDIRCDDGTDCDDNDSNVSPRREERCDSEGRDEDCDPSTLAGNGADGDYDGDRFVSDRCCNLVSNGTRLQCGLDCDDERIDINPKQRELLFCDGEDSDCDGDRNEYCSACECTLPQAQVACWDQDPNCRLVACVHGFGDCDHVERNGCETNLALASDCGGCGKRCDPNATCLAVLNAPHECACNEGYVGSGTTCMDANECAVDNGGCDSAARCDNAPGGRTCTCGDGYEGEGEGQGSCVPALLGLSLSAGTLLPVLDRSVTAYEVELPLSTETITLVPNANDGTVVEINGQIVARGASWQSPLLALGLNHLALTLHEDGRAARQYTLLVHRGYEQAYVKASNTGRDDMFGEDVAVSGDLLVIGTPEEASRASGVNGNGADNGAPASGAAYVFVRRGGVWWQEAYLKASNSQEGDRFGCSVAVDGNTVVVGADHEDSSASGVNGNPLDEEGGGSGAAYVFVRENDVWSQQAYLKPGPDGAAGFGTRVAVDGDTIVVGVRSDFGAPPPIDGPEEIGEPSWPAGAAFVFERAGATWSPQAVLRASNPSAHDGFADAVAVSGDTIVVGAPREDGAATGVNGDESDNSVMSNGAAYVFERRAGTWSQEAYLKGIGTRAFDEFGHSVDVDADTIVVGAPYDSTSANGLAGFPDDAVYASGAVYVFTRNGAVWAPSAWLKAANLDEIDQFGSSVAVSETAIVVGAPAESSSARGIGGEPFDETGSGTGAAYVFVPEGGTWRQLAYLKPSNTASATVENDIDGFGQCVAISGDTIAVAAPMEDSAATGVDGDGENDGARQSGAAYVFR